MTDPCRSCGHAHEENTQYCGNCGALLDTTLEYSDPFKSFRLRSIFVYYGLVLLFNLVFSKASFSSRLNRTMGLDLLFILLTLITASYNLKELIPLFRINKIKPHILGLVILAAIAFSCIVNYVITPMNSWLFGVHLNYYTEYMESSSPVLFMILSIAVMPAIFEEIAFRGFIFNHLVSFTGTQTALIVSSFLFSILHLSFISMFWLFPFALGLGWMRLKYNTLWYGIFIHFFFNLTTCIIHMNEIKHLF